MKTKKGISLITLIITIVIVVILAVAVVLTFTKNNPINSSKIANLVQLKTSMQDAINLYVSKDFTKNEGSRTLKNIIIDDDKTSLIDNTSEVINTTKEGINLTLYRIDKDKYYNMLKVQIGSTPTKDSKWYIDDKGIVYLVYDFMKNVPSFMKENNSLVSSVSPFVVVLGEALQESFAESIDDIQIDGVIGVGEDTSVEFDTSKIEGYSYSKWTINNSPEKLGTDDETKYEKELPIELNITSPGEYYIHILVANSTGLKVEKISSVIKVEEKPDVWDGTSETSFEGGTGTQEDPYIIKTAKQLAYFRDQVNSKNTYANKYIKLDANIDLANIDWKPIGESTTYYFEGNFDGNNKKIYNLNITSDTYNQSYKGLFGYVKTVSSESSIYIKDLVIESGSVNTKSMFSSAIVGFAMIDNGKDLYIKNCINKANINNDVASSSYVGGIVARTQAGNNANESDPSVIIENCYNYGQITCNNKQGNVGGIIGSNNYKIIIKTCGNNGKIDSLGQYVGGIAGMVVASKYSYVENSYNKGDIKGGDKTLAIGGLVGSLSGSVINCYNEGYISSSRRPGIGGIAGEFEANSKSSDDLPEIKNCYNAGDLRGLSEENLYVPYIGGIVGSANSTYSANAKIINCYNKGNITTNYDKKSGSVIGVSSLKVVSTYYLDTSYSKAVGSGELTGATSKTEEEFKKLSGEEGAVVDILNSGVEESGKVWTINQSKNDGYPILKWQ